MRDAVTLVPHDPEWAVRFDHERQRLAAALGEGVAIAHVGSTAIAGLAAKPYIDLLIGHPGDESRGLAGLLALGYVEEGARDGHRWLCWPAPEQRAFIAHLVPLDGEVWTARLTFRDRLRASGELREAYATLKRRLATAHPDDLNGYTAGKAAFVRAVVIGEAVPR